MKRKRDITILISVLIVFVTLIFHGYFMIAYQGSDDHFRKYPSAAELLNRNLLPKERLIDFSPFYLYFHLMIIKTGLDPVIVSRSVQLLIISLSALFIYLMINLYFKRYLALTASFIFILSREILIYERVLEPEAFMIFFIIAFMYYFSLFILNHGSPIRNILISSFFFSLTLITRANLFLLILILPVYIYYKSPHVINGKKRQIFYSILFLIPVLITLSALWIRNFTINGNFLPYYQNPGYIMFEGNNPNSTGQSAIYPPLVDEMSVEYKNIPDVHHKIYRDFARGITKKNLTISEVNNFWSEKARNFISENPLHFIKLELLKINYFFNNYERHDLGSAFTWGNFLAGKFNFFFPFWIISLTALLGMILNVRKVLEYFIFYLIFFVQFGVLLVGYVSSRQRVAIISVMIFFAVSVIPLIIRNRKLIILFSVVIVIGYFVLNIKSDRMEEEDFLWNSYHNSHEYWTKARIERNGFRIDKAVEFTERSVAKTPWLINDRIPASIPGSKKQIAEGALMFVKKNDRMSFSDRFNLAILLIEAGRLSESYNILISLEEEHHFFKRDFDHSSQPYYFIGLIEEKLGRTAEAIECYKKAQKGSPGSLFSLSKLYVLTGEKRYYNKIVRYFDKLDAEFITGKDLFSHGSYNKAVRKLLYVVEILPNLRKALVFLSVALERSGDHIGAYNVYLRALKRGLDPVLFKDDIKKIFGRRVEIEPKKPASFYYYGIILEQCGDFKKAMRIYREGLKLKPEDQHFMKRINNLNHIFNN